MSSSRDTSGKRSQRLKFTKTAAAKRTLKALDHLSRIDRIAIAYAGLASQTIFKYRTHPNVTAGDYVVISKIVESLTDKESFETRNAGFQRATEIVKSNALEVEQIVGVLIEKTNQCLAIKNAPCREHFTTSSRSPAGEPASRRRGMDGTVARYLS